MRRFVSGPVEGGVHTHKERISAPPHLFLEYSLAIPISQFLNKKGIVSICILVPLGINWYNESLGDLGLIKKGSGALFPEILIFHIFSFLE